MSRIMFSKRNPSRDGRWTKEEHELFMKGLAIHGRSWTKVADVVKTRSTVQVRSHAQKFEMKAAKRAQRALAAQARSRKQEGGDIAGFTENIYEGTSCAFDLTDYEYQDPYDISGECGSFEDVTPLSQMGAAETATNHDLHMIPQWSEGESDSMFDQQLHMGASMWYQEEPVSTMTTAPHDIDILASDAMLIEDALMMDEAGTQPVGNVWETEYDGFLNLNPAEADLGQMSHNLSSTAHDISGNTSMFAQF